MIYYAGRMFPGMVITLGLDSTLILYGLEK